MDGIWIRSQSGARLIFCKAIVLNPDTLDSIDGIVDEKNTLSIGNYKTARQAFEIIDDIQKHIFNGVHEVYQMPEE